MAAGADAARVAMQVARDAVIASIQIDLDDAVLERFRRDLLERIHESGARNVILDLSGMDTLDSEEFAQLRRTIRMAEIMGARSVMVGLSPGIVSSLIDTGADVDGVVATRDLDQAWQLIEPAPQAGSPAQPLEEEPAAADDEPGREGDGERP